MELVHPRALITNGSSRRFSAVFYIRHSFCGYIPKNNRNKNLATSNLDVATVEFLPISAYLFTTVMFLQSKLTNKFLDNFWNFLKNERVSGSFQNFKFQVCFDSFSYLVDKMQQSSYRRKVRPYFKHFNSMPKSDLIVWLSEKPKKLDFCFELSYNSCQLWLKPSNEWLACIQVWALFLLSWVLPFIYSWLSFRAK